MWGGGRGVRERGSDGRDGGLMQRLMLILTGIEVQRR